MKVAAIYNPQEMQEEMFLARFVVRFEAWAELLGAIRRFGPEQGFEHLIIQGQRGQGKTTLLRKLAIAVRDDAELADWLVPVLFREEEYLVTSLCRLWELVGDYLAERPEFEGLTECFEASFSSLNYERDCFAILADALRQAGKSVLLLIDNFGEMLRKFDLND